MGGVPRGGGLRQWQARAAACTRQTILCAFQKGQVSRVGASDRLALLPRVLRQDQPPTRSEPRRRCWRPGNSDPVRPGQHGPDRPAGREWKAGKVAGAGLRGPLWPGVSVRARPPSTSLAIRMASSSAQEVLGRADVPPAASQKARRRTGEPIPARPSVSAGTVMTAPAQHKRA